MVASPVDFGSIPISAGKTKALWDAIRQAASGGPQDPAAAPTMQQSVGLPQAAPVPQGPTPPANVLPPKPPISAGPPAMPAPAGGSTPVPPPTMPTPAPDAPAPAPIPQSQVLHTRPPLVPPAPTVPLPSDPQVQNLQGEVNSAYQKPSLMQRLQHALPALIMSGVGIAARAPAAVQGVAQGQDVGIAERDKERAALIQQLDTTSKTRAQEFDAVQRATALRDAAGVRAQASENVAGTAAGSREKVADTNVAGRQGVADTAATSRTDVQTLKNMGGYNQSMIGANGRIIAAKYTADAAANRQTRNIDAASDRQQAGFGHQDTKPTAMEDQRADMSKSLDTLTDRIDQLTQSRPDLFGKGGYLKAGWGKLAGTSDPDIAELNAIKENLGQISLSAHGMRNAGHIAAAADSVLNGFKDSPEATRSATAASRASASTMKTYTRPTLVKGQGGAAPAATGTKGDPLGLGLK